MSKRQPARYKPKEKISSFILRLPDTYDLALKGLVEKGVAKSKNQLIVEIIGTFLSDLQKRAENTEKKENG
jgi:hypothetical protein